MPERRPIFMALEVDDIGQLLGVGSLSPEARACLRAPASGIRGVGPIASRLAKHALVVVQLTPAIARELLPVARRNRLPEVVMKIRMELSRRRP